MSHLLRLSLLLVLLPLLPAQDDERTLRWNQFAKDANEFVHTVDVNPEHRAKAKSKLAKEWDAVFPLL